MAYTLREINDSIPAEKKRADGLWTRFVLRPLSIPVTWLALKLGLKANTVSYISALFSITGGVLLSWNGPSREESFWLPLCGALLLNVFSVFDCVDGNVARVTRSASPWGAWADAVMGFVAYTAVFISTGIYVYVRGGFWLAIVMAAVTSSANLLTRVAYQIYKNIVGGEEAHESVSFERRLAENVGVTGIMMPALILCHFAGGMIIIVCFNLAFYLGGCVVTIVKLARKAGR
jgi:phosphatidylglycerophosphate synthase